MILVDAPHPASVDPADLLKVCEIGKGRSSGPGGQHRNKVETQVTMTHQPTGVSGQASERRSSMENKKVALRRLRLALAVQVRAPVPIGEARSPMWIERSKGSQIACNPGHSDFPAMLAEAMDMLAACGWDPKRASLRLSCTPSQLIKLIKEHPPAMVTLNKEREAAGKHRLS